MVPWISIKLRDILRTGVTENRVRILLCYEIKQRRILYEQEHKRNSGES